jgi:hypothetical protein
MSFAIRKLHVFAAVTLLLALVASVVITNNVFTAENPGMNDFMSRWEGARSFFQDGLSPYSDAASLNIQQRIYGRAVEGSEDPGFFVYPFYTVFIVGPTVGFSYAWASAIWMVVLVVCLIVALILLLSLYRWQPSPVMLGALLLYTLMDYFAVRGLFLGQPSHLVYVLQVAALWAIFRNHQSFGGLALAVSTFKPQMGYLLVPFVLLFALRSGRLRLVAAFALTMLLLLGLSFALQPDWFGDWLDQVRLYPEYTSAAYPDTGSPVWIVVQHWLGLGDLAEWAISGALLLLMLSAWYSVLVQRHDERFLWTVVLTLIVTHLIALRTATPHFVVFNIAIIFYLKRIARKRGVLSAIGALAVLAIFNWAQFLITVQGRETLEHPSLFIPMPFVMLVLIWLTRRLWWSEFLPQLPVVKTLRVEHVA